MCFGYGTVRDCGGECVPYLPELHQVVVIAGDSDLCCCVSYFLFKCGVYGAKKTLFSRGGEVTVYVLDINQLSLPTRFILFLRLFHSLWPFQLYFIP